MPRILLTDEERLARKKARAKHSFSNAAYKHFDPSKDGYGSPEEWMRAAEAMVGGRLVLKPNVQTKNADLDFLMMEEMPADIAGLKKGYRNALFVYHPDHGGSTEQCRKAVEAFERLLKNYQ